jgi:hypothetical protein
MAKRNGHFPSAAKKPRIQTGHAIGSIRVLAGRSEVEFPDYLRGGGLCDLLHFSREVRVRRLNRGVNIKLNLGIGELLDASSQHLHRSHVKYGTESIRVVLE